MPRLGLKIGLATGVVLLGMYQGVFADSTAAIDAGALVSIIRENAERLRSGKCVATGTFTFRQFHYDDSGRLTSNEPSKVNVYREQISCAFDFDNNRFSFRREREPTQGEHLRPSDGLFHYIGLPDRAIIVHSMAETSKSGKRVAFIIQDPVFPKNDPTGFCQPVFDPRAIGFGGIERLHGRFEDLFAYYFPDEPINLRDEGAGILRLDRHTVLGERENIELRSWWCDPQQGLQPVKYTLRTQVDANTRMAAIINKRFLPQQESEVTWSQISGVWVPKTVNLFGIFYRADGRLQLEIDWQNLNQPIPVTAFDWRELDLPKGTLIKDERLHGDAPVVLKVIGQSIEVEFTPLQGKRKESRTVSRFMVLNAMAVGAFMGYAAKKLAGRLLY